MTRLDDWVDILWSDGADQFHAVEQSLIGCGVLHYQSLRS
jgi:hypothetical protein